MTKNSHFPPQREQPKVASNIQLKVGSLGEVPFLHLKVATNDTAAYGLKMNLPTAQDT